MIKVSDELIYKNFAVYSANSVYEAITNYSHDVLWAWQRYPFDEDVDYVITKPGYKWGDQTLAQMMTDKLDGDAADIVLLGADALPRVYGTELTPGRWLIWSLWQLNNMTWVNEQSVQLSTL